MAVSDTNSKPPDGGAVWKDEHPLLIGAAPAQSELAVADAQTKMNRSTAGQWGMYRSHREAIERLLAPKDPQEDRRSLCVLGAGNCNDLDLKWLTRVFADVHLVDIDADAVRGALSRQRARGISVHAPVDLTAAADLASAWKAQPPGDAEITRLVRASDEAPIPQLGRFDVVLSPCVLTQLLNPLRKTIGRSHPRFDEALHAMRRRHLRLMRDLLLDRGRGVLLIDLISSETYDELARVPEGQLSSFMDKFVDRGKSFVGLDPRSIRRALEGDPSLRATMADLRISRPWLWHLSLRRTFLVYGVEFARRPANTKNPPTGAIVVT